MKQRPFNSRDVWRPSLLLVAALVAADQVIKAIAVATLPLGSGTAVTSWFNVVHLRNPGAAFSLLADAGGWQRPFLTGLGIVVSLALAWLLRHGVASRMEAAGFVLMMAGALGNVIDRLRLGAVVDYLDFYWGDLHWPAFNLADIFVVSAAALLVLSSLSPARPQAGDASSAPVGETGGRRTKRQTTPLDGPKDQKLDPQAGSSRAQKTSADAELFAKEKSDV